MKKLLYVGLATVLGYVVGAITLLVWAGQQIYEEMFGDDD